MKDMTINQIANLIRKDWKKISPYAQPYLNAMYCLDSVNGNYGMDSGREVVNYFLANASSWRGEVAKQIKTELKRRLKG